MKTVKPTHYGVASDTPPQLIAIIMKDVPINSERRTNNLFA